MQTNQNCFHAYFIFIIMHLGKLRVRKVTFLRGHVLVSSLLHSSLVDFLAQEMYKKTQHILFPPVDKGNLNQFKGGT